VDVRELWTQSRKSYNDMSFQEYSGLGEKCWGWMRRDEKVCSMPSREKIYQTATELAV
jgi:hypothetical protein